MLFSTTIGLAWKKHLTKQKQQQVMQRLASNTELNLFLDLLSNGCHATSVQFLVCVDLPTLKLKFSSRLPSTSLCVMIFNTARGEKKRATKNKEGNQKKSVKKNINILSIYCKKKHERTLSYSKHSNIQNAHSHIMGTHRVA